jgi:hypothetical protein
MSAPGSNVCCYTGYVPQDQGLTNLATKNAELLHQRSLCLAAVDVAADTVRANLITANEVQAQIIIQSDPIVAATAIQDPTINIGVQTLVAAVEQYIGGPVIGTTMSLVLQNANGIALDSTSTGLVVSEDGWYQISFNIQAPVATGSTIDVGIGINGLVSTAVPLVPVPTGAPTLGFISGSIMMNLIAGDTIQLFLFGTPGNTFTLTVPLTANIRLSAARVGP